MRLRGPEWLIATVGLLAANVLYWKLRILDTGTVLYDYATRDLYIEHYPMAEYGFSELAAGRFPLWNPHQLLGLPFFAIPHTGLLYPANLVRLVLDTAVATEVLIVAHLLLAGLGTWLLVRTLGFGAPAALAASVTGMWSGHLVLNASQPTVLFGVCWLPATVWLVERTLRGSRVAPFALALAVALQVFNGATERLVYTLYAAGFWSLCRLSALAWGGALRPALARGGLLLAGVLAGILLSAPQLLPSLELASASARGKERLSEDEALYWGLGTTSPARLLSEGLSFTGRANAGLLPLLGLALGLGAQRFRGVWALSVALAALAASLALGGPLYDLYHLTPIGGMFRIPLKFLTLYTFALSIAAAVATQRLCDWRRANPSRRELWSNPGWISAVVLLLGGTAWLWQRDSSVAGLVAALSLLALYGLVPRAPWRGAVIALLLALHAGILFLSMTQTGIRPLRAREVFDEQRGILESARDYAGLDRLFMSAEFLTLAPFTMKQGMLTRSYFSTDYEALALTRYGRFFERASAPSEEESALRFAGFYELHPESSWKLMDLTSTRLYAFRRSSPTDLAITRLGRSGGFFRFDRTKTLSIWLRKTALPRAYYVPRARVLGDGEQVLDGLVAPGFDPRREVLLETGHAAGLQLPLGSDGRGSVRVEHYAPELVVLEAETAAPGFVVLTDLHYPGWKAWANGEPVPLLRANYLMRSVAVREGATRITFAYRPESLRWGLALGGATALGLAVLAALSWRRSRAWAGRAPARR